ncbi:hypothetical protein [Streptomyces microflavus]|uniref:hypothetical protein n=1 Tax=Streptomyces microflavus TaxID=1919 RepID=UPI0033EA529A
MTQVVTLSAPNAQDCVALAEIELCGELMIAASTAHEERLSPDRIDEVLNVRDDGHDADDGCGADGVRDVDGVRGADGARGGDPVGDVDHVRDAGHVRDVTGGMLGVRGVGAWTTVPRQAAHRGVTSSGTLSATATATPPAP